MDTVGLISIIVLFAAIAALGGAVLVAKELMTKETLIRAGISVAVFAVIYWGSGFIIGWHEYDYVKAIEFLAAVVGAGCYWVGSNRR